MADYPRICTDCRLPILTPVVPHRCERLVCPECLSQLSRKGFCPHCCVRYEMPTRDPFDRLAELEAWALSSPRQEVAKETDA